jgi:hypothetical protein
MNLGLGSSLASGLSALTENRGGAPGFRVRIGRVCFYRLASASSVSRASTSSTKSSCLSPLASEREKRARRRSSCSLRSPGVSGSFAAAPNRRPSSEACRSSRASSNSLDERPADRSRSKSSRRRVATVCTDGRRLAKGESSSVAAWLRAAGALSVPHRMRRRAVARERRK